MSRIRTAVPRPDDDDFPGPSEEEMISAILADAPAVKDIPFETWQLIRRNMGVIPDDE